MVGRTLRRSFGGGASIVPICARVKRFPSHGVNNAIKLIGNQYLARLYRLAAGRLDLPAWQASVQRKLAATESVCQRMSDASAGRRLETLEWMIIVLITVSIVLSFVGVHQESASQKRP